MTQDATVPQTINLAEKLASFDDLWSPKIAGALNGQYVKLVKLRGEFVWHSHDSEDELFLVLRGRLVIEFRNGRTTVGQGEFIIVPRGVEHRPVADQETHVLLFEPTSTLNTGNVRNDRTVETLERI
jgi:mannose-6-phosphate isomerase-like protein (cupin superfamily)